MLSSGDISSMFAAQNQMFMGQNQYASQIGPNPANTLAAWGVMRQPQQMQAAMPGMHAPPPAVSYAPSTLSGAGYGVGTQAAGMGMAGIGAGMAGLGVMAGIGSMMMPRAGRLLDPIMGFAGGWGGKVGSFMGAGGPALFGGGLMGGLAGAALPLAGATVAAKYGSAFIHGGQQQQMMNSQLGQFGFINHESRTGVGFTRSDAQAIGNQVRQLSHIPEMMTSVEELTRLIPKLKAMGAMQGVKDATEFSSRFKEAVRTMRDMSKILGSTMEEASEFFRHSRRMGFLGRTDQLKNTLNTQFTSAQTGMSMQQTMAMQAGGADMATQMGISRRRGANAVMSTAQAIQAGLESGKVSEESLMDMTGEEGPAAISSAAQRMVGLTAQMAKNTPGGRLSMFGLAKFDKNGRYAGIDEDLLRRYNAGEVSKDELMRRVSGFTAQQKRAVTNKAGTIAMDFAAKAGPGGIAGFMDEVLRANGYKDEDSQGIVLQRYGLSETDVDVFQQMKGLQGSSEGDIKAYAQRQARESLIRDRTDPSKIWRRLKTKMHSKLFGGVEQMGAKVFTDIGNAWDSWVDDMVGRHVVTMSKEGAQKLSQAFSSAEGRQHLTEMFQAASGMKPQLRQQRASGLGKAVAAGGLLLGGLATGGAMTAIAGGGLLLDQAGGGVGLESVGLKVDRAFKSFARMIRTNSSEETTGRDSMEQFEHLMGQFGVEGPASEKAEKELYGKYAALQKYGAGGGARNDKARASVQALIAKLNKDGKFAAADDGKKIELLAEAINGGGMKGAGGADLKLASLAMQEKGLIKGDMDVGHALAVAYGGGAKGRRDRIDIRAATGSFSEVQDFASIKAVKDAGEKATKDLTSLLGEDATAALRKPGYASAIEAMLDEGQGDGSLYAALQGDQMGTALEKLKKFGLGEKDLDGLRRASESAMGAEGGPGKVKAHLKAFRDAEKVKDLTLYKRGIGASAASIEGDSALKKAMTDFANADSGDFGGMFDKIKAEMMSIRERARATTDKKEREKILAEAGSMSERLGQRLDLTDSEKTLGDSGRTMTKESLAKALGVKESELDGMGLDGEFKISKKILREFRDKKAFDSVGAGLVGENEKAMAGDKDERLLKVLTKLETTLDLSITSVQLANADSDKKEAIKKKLDEGIKQASGAK